MDSFSKALAFHLHQRSNLSPKYQTAPTIFILLLFLSSLCFLASKSTDFIWVFAFFAAFLIILTFAIPHIPSLRHLLNKGAYPLHVSVKNPIPDLNGAPYVVWSIGSNPKWETSGISGYWVKGFRNGDVYEGEFHRGKCSGSGVYHYYMCGKYEGDWIDGKYAGYGVETWAKGSKYRGMYRNGLRHRDVYEGEWSNGQSHGCGVYSSKDGCKYVGEFKWGVKHGFGHYHYRNGDVYAGEYFADMMHGFGVYKFGNGHQYEGSWHEGQRQGFGMYTFRSGEIQSGYWQNGVLDHARTIAESPLLPNSCKISNVVEEARDASKKAYGVAVADDRMNKAITAANRAANAARVAAVKAIQNRMHLGKTNHGTLIPSL